jgi:transposase-like protein
MCNFILDIKNKKGYPSIYAVINNKEDNPMNSITNNTGIKELYFTEEDLDERWREVKEDFWGDLKRETLIGVKRLLETHMEIEVQDIIGTKRWQHMSERYNYRNGSYNRSLWTEYGWIDAIKVPRLRLGGVNTKVFKKYERRSNEVNKLILKMFLAGVSTRRVEEVLKPIYGAETITASTVSNISKELNKLVEKYHSRQLKDDYQYLILDGIYLKAKSPIKSKRRCILVAYGIKEDGRRELIDYKLVRKGESQIAWECFLMNLCNHGLKGENLKLIVMDGNKGLINACDVIWPDVKLQRCWSHKLRNVANYLPKKLQKACTSEAHSIYDAKDKTEAIKAFKRWANVWRPICNKAVECVEGDLEELLNFYDCPQSLWIKIRTTNAIERVFREVRRRTRPISCFTNTESVDRIIFAVFNRQNNIWKDTPLKIKYEITQNS